MPAAAEAPMTKIKTGIAVLVVATALSAAGYAAAKGGGGGHGGGHGGGGHGGGHFHGGGHGGGHFGGRHFGGGRVHFGGGRVHFGRRSFARPGFRGNRAFAVHNIGPHAVRALSPRAATRALRHAGALRNPA